MLLVSSNFLHLDLWNTLLHMFLSTVRQKLMALNGACESKHFYWFAVLSVHIFVSDMPFSMTDLTENPHVFDSHF